MLAKYIFVTLEDSQPLDVQWTYNIYACHLQYLCYASTISARYETGALMAFIVSFYTKLKDPEAQW